MFYVSHPIDHHKRRPVQWIGVFFTDGLYGGEEGGAFGLSGGEAFEKFCHEEFSGFVGYAP